MLSLIAYFLHKKVWSELVFNFIFALDLHKVDSQQ